MESNMKIKLLITALLLISGLSVHATNICNGTVNLQKFSENQEVKVELIITEDKVFYKGPSVALTDWVIFEKIENNNSVVLASKKSNSHGGENHFLKVAYIENTNQAYLTYRGSVGPSIVVDGSISCTKY